MPKSRVSSSAVDCICCGLGAVTLLWLATVAVSSDKDQVREVVVTIKTTYERQPIDFASSALLEGLSLNGLALADFYVDGTVSPRWQSWPTADRGKFGRCYFRPNEDFNAGEVSLLSRTSGSAEKPWNLIRSITIQGMSYEDATIDVELHDPIRPIHVEVFASTIQERIPMSAARLLPDHRRIEVTIAADGVRCEPK